MTTDTTHIRSLYDQARYSEAYLAIQAQIAGNSDWSEDVVEWLDDAAAINGPELNYKKILVFEYNRIAAGLPDTPEVTDQIQQVSDHLAQKVIEQYLEAVQQGKVISPEQLFNYDVRESVKELNPSAGVGSWPGGPAGAAAHGFPTDEFYEGDNLTQYLTTAPLAAVAAIGKIIGDLGNDVAEAISEFYLKYGGLIDSVDSIGDAIDLGAILARDLADMLRRGLADPLVLDLDGDGIELTALGATPAAFDLDGDGIRERTGWVSNQDGLLALDRNRDGTINDVSELFGKIGTDGFVELKTLDTNNDNRIDVADTAYSDLLVWRDLNLNGQSDAGELVILAAANIASISLASAAVDRQVAGNVIAREASFTLTSGVQQKIGSVWFQLEQETSPRTVPLDSTTFANLIGLPDLGRIGAVPSLAAAATHDPGLKQFLESLVADADDFSTPSAFESDVNELIYRWTGVFDQGPTSTGQPDNRWLFALEKFSGQTLPNLTAAQLTQARTTYDNLVDDLSIRVLVQLASTPRTKAVGDLLQQLDSLDTRSPTYQDDLFAAAQAGVNRISAAGAPDSGLTPFLFLEYDPATNQLSGDFEAFAQWYVDRQPSMASWAGSAPPWFDWYEKTGYIVRDVAHAMGLEDEYWAAETGWGWLIGMNGTVAKINGDAGANALVGGAAAELLLGYEGNDTIDGNGGDDRIIGGIGDDLLRGGAGNDHYIHATGDGLDTITDASGSRDIVYFSDGLLADNLIVERVGATNSLKLHFGNPLDGVIVTDLLLNNRIYGRQAGAESFYFDGSFLTSDAVVSKYLQSLATAGNDTIGGFDANETIDGGLGNDTLSGNFGDDRLLGGAGNDILYGNNEADYLDGGEGDDRLDGGYGSDTFFYDVGGGNDIVVDYAGSWGGTDVLVFGYGITPVDIRFSVPKDDSTDCVITFSNRPGSVRLEAWLDNFSYTIEQIKFADGTIWNIDQILNELQKGQTTPASDTIYGTRYGEVLSGGDGNDVIYARNGVDTLVGGLGDDRLEGYFDGDTYVYALGDGNDSIADYAGSWGGTDILLFGAGISPADIKFSVPSNDSTDALITFLNGPGSIRLEAWLDNFDYVIEQIRFADGTIWHISTILAKVQEGQTTSGNDAIFGSRFGETLTGGAGNDALYARNGFDTLIGGVGNDYMEGYFDGDTYIYNIGDGDDSIADYAGSWGGTDVIQFGPGIAPEDVRLSVPADDSTDYIIKFANMPGSIRVNAWMDNFSYEIEQFRFADGTVWDTTRILAEVQKGQTTPGNDVIYGSRHGETLSGGEGNDVVYARNGSDTLIGGPGNDRLEGFYDGDTYVYNRGDGNDVVADYAASWGGTDIVSFGPSITQNDVSVWRSWSDFGDVIIGLNDGSGTVLLDNQLAGSGYGMEQVKFVDGTTWSAAQLAQMATLIGGDAAGNTINGTASADTIDGRDGNDTINGGAGDDRLIGGQGNDTLNGGDGSDTAEYRGRWFEYTIVRNGAGFTATDARGVEGTDTLSAIETLKFADRTFAPDAMLDGWKDGKALAVEGRAAGTEVGIVTPAAAGAFQGQMVFSLLDDAGGRFVIDPSSGRVSIADGATFSDAPASLKVRVGVEYGAEAVRTFDLTVPVDHQPTDLQLIKVSAAPTMVLNGAASPVGTGDFRLTPNVTRVAGSIWGEVDLSTDVTWTTKMYFGGSDRYGADGMAFGLQNVGPNVLSGFGGVLPNGSFGIKFDTYANTEIGEPNSDFSQFVNNGVQGSASLSFDSYRPHGNLENGAWHDVVISWKATSKTLSYTLNGTLVGSKTYDVVALNFAGDTTAYFGFGGLTGGYSNEHRVQILSVQTRVPTLSVNENAAAGTLVGKLAGVDPDAGDQMSYTLVDSTGTPITDPNFEIVNGNELRVKSGAAIDFEAQATLSVLVKVTDTAGASIIRPVDIAVSDAPGSVINGSSAAETLAGSPEADRINGFAGDDIIYGGAGDDFIAPGDGNDSVNGDAGNDTVNYNGVRAGYALVTTGGSIQVTDIDAANGDEGTDTLLGVEHASFADQALSLATPIVLDLDGDGIELVTMAKSKAKFDFDGDGARDKTGWIGKGDGLLVLDRNGNGHVDGAAELSFTGDKPGARSDLDGLRAFDGNSDGLISAADDVFAKLMIWQDRDRDGVVDNKELLGLRKAGIATLDLDATSTEQTWNWDSNVVVNQGGFRRVDGSQGTLADVAFVYETSANDVSDGSDAYAVEPAWVTGRSSLLPIEVIA